MAEISRTALFGKLNPIAYKALENATVFCKLRGNPYVEIVHWLHQIMQLQDSDFHRIIRHFDLNASKLAADTQAALDRLPRGATSISDLSGHFEEVMERSWVYASLLFKEFQVRTGHVVLAMVKHTHLRNILIGVSKEFEKIKGEALSDDMAKITSGSPEDAQPPSDGSGTGAGAGASPGESSGAMAPAAMGKEEALKKFCKDLTENARAGKMDPIVGRDEEIRQCIDILMRRRQNNPLLTGEAGVGKTAVVEGFAQRIVKGDVPPQLKDVRMLELDVGLLQAGASMKGEFENRLRQVIDEVQGSPKPIILFIDEAHTLMGAGGQAGTGDAAQLLKPALARGTLRTIAATTQSEYKQHIEKDPAMTRRFQVVKVDEPDEKKCLQMIRGLANVMEKHFKVQVLDEALDAAVKLSRRYIQGRYLPDKAVSLIDTACARVAVSLHATPAEVDDARKHIDALDREIEIIDRELATGIDHDKRRAELGEDLAKEQERLKGLEEKFAKEKAVVEKILAVRAQLRGTGDGKVDSPSAPALTDADREKHKEELKKLQAELTALQGEHPMILPSVDGQAVAAVIADWTGIPVGRMVKNEVDATLKLADTLAKRIIGQRHALDMITDRIRTARTGLENPNKPVGVFLLAGPSGVGKTETALALAEALYGGEESVITINMSEYQEAHKVSLLMGSPPGYVGYGKGGVMTEAVRRKPYSVLLLDEVEKAHADIHEVFFQVFDKGWMKDSEGVDINFRNTIILLTTNVGTDMIANLCKDPALMPDPKALTEALNEPLRKVFPLALLGRMVVIPYYPLSDDMIKQIARLQLGRIGKRVQEGHKVPFEFDPGVLDAIVARCTERESGGRMIDKILTNSILPRLSNEFLSRLAEGRAVARVKITVQDGDFAYLFD
ncbi:MAG: type VI secretion system ATPase TssH [Phycisphaerales bacterium]